LSQFISQPQGDRIQIDYLPSNFTTESEYESLYAYSIDGIGLDFEEQPLPIEPGVSEEDVYTFLPTAEVFEFGGIIEHDVIRYQWCAQTMAWTDCSADCTWHSHPTGSISCDQPSAMDIRSFLVNRNLRAVTAGRDIAWVFDKQSETIPFIRRLLAWEQENQVKRMVHWMASPQGIDGYLLEALSVLGVASWLKKNPSADDWVPVIESIGIKVRIFQRSQICV
jgi:hypothetical protein